MVEKLTILNELFVDFIKKSTLAGEFQQLLLKQTDKGYEVSVIVENVISCEGVLLKKNFVMYGNVGNITIKNVKRFISLISDMKGNITIEKRNDRILISSEKIDIEYILCSEEFIETTLPEPVSIEFDDGFRINKDLLTSLDSKAKLLDVNSVSLKVNKKIFVGSVEESDKFSVKEEVAYKDCESKYGRWFFKLSAFLEDKVVMSFDTDYPVRIISKNTNFELKYVIAPFVKVEQKEEQKKEDSKDEGTEDDV